MIRFALDQIGRQYLYFDKRVHGWVVSAKVGGAPYYLTAISDAGTPDAVRANWVLTHRRLATENWRNRISVYCAAETTSPTSSPTSAPTTAQPTNRPSALPTATPTSAPTPLQASVSTTNSIPNSNTWLSPQQQMQMQTQHQHKNQHQMQQRKHEAKPLGFESALQVALVGSVCLLFLALYGSREAKLSSQAEQYRSKPRYRCY